MNPDAQAQLLSYLYWLKSRGLNFPLSQPSPAPDEVNPTSSDDDIRPEDRGWPAHKDAVQCQKCPLHQARPGVAWGIGSEQPKVMIVGDTPGKEAASIGQPFAGESLFLLEKMLASIGLEAAECFFMNLIQCPTTNPDQLRQSYEPCQPFIQSFISKIQPRIIVALGPLTMSLLTEGALDFNVNKGQIKDWNHFKIQGSYHPRSLLRTPELKAESWNHLKQLQHFLAPEARH